MLSERIRATLWGVSLAVVGFFWGLLVTEELLGGMLGAIAGALAGVGYGIATSRCRPIRRLEGSTNGRPLLAGAEQLRGARRVQRTPMEEQHSASFSGMVRALPVRTLTTTDVATAAEDQRECAICIREFTKGDKQRTLPCFHHFHPACVDQWLRRKGSCPICKHCIDGGGVSP